MNHIHDYGSILLASRLRKVSERFYGGVDEVYRSCGVDLPSRCFPILFLLRDRGRVGISELAVQLGQTHAAVSQMSRKLLDHRVVQEWTDPKDDRRRLLALSRQGANLMARLEPVWNAIVAAVDELEVAHPISAPLTAIDSALEASNFPERIRAQLNANAVVEIIPFERRYASDFKRLNLEWLEKYFRVEPIDEQVLSKPQNILRKGGAIFLARRGNEIIGSCALLNKGHGRFELSKMSVTGNCQGLGIGRKLLAAAIESFVKRGAGELFLETNSVLTRAIALYESVGFIHARHPTASAYERSDVYMVYSGQR